MDIKRLNITVPAGKLRQKMTENKPFRKQSDPFRKARSSERWQTLRAMFLNREPICWVCRERPAAELHHIAEAAANPSLFWDVANLAPVCESCHKQVHGAYRRGISPEMLFPKERRLACLA